MLPNQQRQSAEKYIDFVIYFHHYFGSFSSFSSVSSVIHHTFVLPFPPQIAEEKIVDCNRRLWDLLWIA